MKKSPTNKHEGKVVRVSGDKLTTTCSQGKEHCYTLTKDARVTSDGQASKVADLKTGTNVRVTTRNDDESIATSVDSGRHITGVSKA